MRRNLLLLNALALAICLPSLAHAQINAQSRSGTFGQRTLGSTLGNPTSSFGGANGGNAAAAGSLTGNERFVRGARQAGDFVGRGGTDTGAGMVGQQNAGATGGTGLGGMGGMNGMRGNMLGGRGGTSGLGGLFGSQMGQLGRNQFGNQFGQQNMRGGQGTRTQLRTPITLGFSNPGPTIASSRVTTQVTTRLTKIPRLQVTGPLSVTMEGSTAVLTGHVGSEGDRDLAERMVLLEPGISSVRNELQVRPAPEAVPVPTPAAVVTPPVND